MYVLTRVPSDPMKRLVRLYPAEDFLGLLSLPPVCNIVPSDKTTSKFKQFSGIWQQCSVFIIIKNNYRLLAQHQSISHSLKNTR